jgi:hypothetical protein
VSGRWNAYDDDAEEERQMQLDEMDERLHADNDRLQSRAVDLETALARIMHACDNWCDHNDFVATVRQITKDALTR